MRSKTKIKNDLFNISKRLKSIDKNYYIVFNGKKQRFEVHNSAQLFNTLSLVSPYKKLDVRLLNLVRKTRVEHAQELLNSIEAHNQKLTTSNQQRVKDISTCMLKDIYAYAKTGKRFSARDSFLTKWS